MQERFSLLVGSTDNECGVSDPAVFQPHIEPMPPGRQARRVICILAPRISSPGITEICKPWNIVPTRNRITDRVSCPWRSAAEDCINRRISNDPLCLSNCRPTPTTTGIWDMVHRKKVSSQPEKKPCVRFLAFPGDRLH